MRQWPHLRRRLRAEAFTTRYQQSPMSPRLHRLAVALAVGLAVVSSRAATAETPPARGTTVLVTNCNDSGFGSLREAVANAPDDATVDLSQLTCSGISLETGAIDIVQDELTISGPGVDELAIYGSYDPMTLGDQVFTSNSSYGTLTIDNLTVKHGINMGPGARRGGCISVYGNMLLLYARVTNCRAWSTNGSIAAGGGVHTGHDLTVKYSTISDSVAMITGVSSDSGGKAVGGGASVGLAGGDLRMKYNSSVTGNSVIAGSENDIALGGGLNLFDGASISESTIAGNVARVGGGLFSRGDAVTLTNSTVSGNAASIEGAGISMPGGELRLRNSTVASNRVENAAPAALPTASPTRRGIPAAGVHAVTLDMRSTIIAGNSSFGTPADLLAFNVSGDHNLVQSPLSANMPADTIIGIDPELLPLGDYGGGTVTHLPRSDSPVLESGSNPGTDPLLKDQRGFEREVGAGPDIGAVERQGPLDGDDIFADGFELLLALLRTSP